MLNRGCHMTCFSCFNYNLDYNRNEEQKRNYLNFSFVLFSISISKQAKPAIKQDC